MLPPAFSSANTIPPVLITKNVEMTGERWKTPSAEDTGKSGPPPPPPAPSGELPQSFIASDGNIYYVPTEMMSSYQPQRMMDPLQNGTGVNGHEPTLLFSQPPQLNGPQLNAPHLNGPLGGGDVPQSHSGSIPSDSAKDIPQEELKRLIRLQFEYYFCRENLAHDSYLVSQMDSDQYVYISTVAKFNQVRKLTSDINLIVEAIKESPYIQLDETSQKVRANMKRCIVILREIPESTPIGELKALFEHPKCPQWVSFEFAHNDSWYITFECEEDAKKAYRYLHEEVKIFRGRPLMARIKAKTLLSRTVYLPKNIQSQSSVTSTVTTTSINTSQFTTIHQPVNTFTIPPNATIYQPQSFPFYPPGTPVNNALNGPIIPGTWIRPRPAAIFIQPSDLPPPTFASFNNKHVRNTDTSIPFIPNKGRFANRNNNFNKNSKPPQYHHHQHHHQHRSNGVHDSEERPVLRRSQSTGVPDNNIINNSNTSSNTANTPYTAYRKDDDRRFSGAGTRDVNKKEFRGNVEESPRFQRLRERRHHREKDEAVAAAKSNLSVHDSSSKKKPAAEDLTLDLTMDFPALPITNSPNSLKEGLGEEPKSASSLKELASSALQRVTIESASDASADTTTIGESISDIAKSTTTDTSLLEKLTSASISSDLLCTNYGVQPPTVVPRMSYAQMAQKLNLSQGKDLIFDLSDEKVVAFGDVTPKTDSIAKSFKFENEGVDEKFVGSAVSVASTKPPRKISQGSQKASKPKSSSVSELPTGEVAGTVDVPPFPDPAPCSPHVPQKETYASKFGKAASKPVPSSVQLSLSRPNTFCTSAPSTVTWPISQVPPASPCPLKNLPSPKPLMSQIIKTPTHEKGRQQIIEEMSHRIPAVVPAVSTASTASAAHLPDTKDIPVPTEAKEDAPKEEKCFIPVDETAGK